MKDIMGYEGLYAVTEDGQIWSYRRNKYLSQTKDSKGYLRVGLHINGKEIKKLVHRLVAEAYIPNPENKPQVNHKDENKSNNNIDNLEWVTAEENTNYGTRNKRAASSMSKAILCIELNKVFESARQAEREMLVDNSSVSRCCKDKNKTHHGYHWRYI